MIPWSNRLIHLTIKMKGIHISLRDYLIRLVGGGRALRDTAVAVGRVAATVVVSALVALLQVAVLRAARTLRRSTRGQDMHIRMGYSYVQ